MGGDNAPRIVIDGVAEFLASRPGAQVLLHGDEAELAPLVAGQGGLQGRVTVLHAEARITSDMKPSQALRRGKGSSMWNAVEAVRDGRAGASVSAGNTGALMAISMLILRKMEGVHRPAMTAVWPTLRGRTIVLDVGANVEADARQLVTFAIMGEAFARAMLGLARPSVGLLNIGSEEMKGHEEVREAHDWLRAAGLDLDYRGFIEGDDISAGAVDVVVTDGFTGNVALKTGEGVARMLASHLRDAFTSSLPAKAGAVLAMSGLKRLKSLMDPSNVNGGVLLGLGGISVKSHGSADGRGFARACEMAADLAASDFQGEIAVNLGKLGPGGVAA
jgi:glycerol-3-phosphate acyltransferase PlsX